ncbi:hypothetical protein Vafri_8238 [Volvox africanus]|nr:hypothetical protein Vafri_8238 [Volvox africanus]
MTWHPVIKMAKLVPREDFLSWHFNSSLLRQWSLSVSEPIPNPGRLGSRTVWPQSIKPRRHPARRIAAAARSATVVISAGAEEARLQWGGQQLAAADTVRLDTAAGAADAEVQAIGSRLENGDGATSEILAVGKSAVVGGGGVVTRRTGGVVEVTQWRQVVRSDAPPWAHIQIA